MSVVGRISRFRLSISRFIWHPTGQCGQMLFTVSTALSHLYLRSTSAPVGHTSMHAPQNSQPDSSRDVPCDVPMSTLSDLSSSVSALSPRTSSHTRTQRAQTMHRFMSISQYGSLTASGRLRLLYDSGESISISRNRTVSLSSQRSFLGQVTHLSFTDTCRRQMSDGPQRSMRWHVRQPCGCSDMSRSMMPRRRSTMSSEFVVTRMPGITGVVQDAGLPGNGR